MKLTNHLYLVARMSEATLLLPFIPSGVSLRGQTGLHSYGMDQADLCDNVSLYSDVRSSNIGVGIS